jgi:MYXO-CTERM domain-containing protein
MLIRLHNALAGAAIAALLSAGPAGAATLTTLASFGGPDGANPNGGLARDAQGNLYGTTSAGGAGAQGTVFELAAGSPTITALASFAGAQGVPNGGLARDAQGNLYGTAQFAGARFQDGGVFALAAGSTTITTLALFTGANGANPQSGPVLDAQGNLYGTTFAGGSKGVGTVFELPSGGSAITTLATFNGPDGALPVGGLVRDAQGNLYGTTSGGGPTFVSPTSPGPGTVFELAAGSGAVTTLATFNGANGASPQAGVVRDAQGNLYGTTNLGGANNLGTVFEVVAGSGAVTTLASFAGANGANPLGGLVLDAQGNLYGTTSSGGANNLGTIFEVVAGSGTITTLASFDGANGSRPVGDLLLDAQGNLYGVTRNGGASNRGTIFVLSVPEPPSLVPMGLGLAGLAALVARRRPRV